MINKNYKCIHMYCTYEANGRFRPCMNWKKDFHPPSFAPDSTFLTLESNMLGDIIMCLRAWWGNPISCAAVNSNRELKFPFKYLQLGRK